jgi:hypothetical protein
MSMDLSRALVPTEGNLDPIDGYVTFRILQSSAIESGDDHLNLDLGMTLWTAHWFVFQTILGRVVARLMTN